MRKFLVIACVACVLAAIPAEAHCNKSAVELVQFMVPKAPANFADINAGIEAPGSSHYNLTLEAEQFCPNVFILEDTPATDKFPEFWEVKFDSSEAGTQDDVAISIIKTLSPVLIAQGYQDKPYIQDGDDPGSYRMEWDGPSDTWVSVTTYQEDEAPGKTFLAIKVCHKVK
jgi:hypothetical protein